MVSGATENISAVGLKLKLSGSERLKANDMISVRVDSHLEETQLTLQGRVVWSRVVDDESGQQEIGVQLTGMDLPEWDRWLALLNWYAK